MNRFVLPAALAAAGALALPAAAGAAPKLKTSPSFAGSRLVVTVTSAKAFTKRTRPLAVKVRAVDATYSLSRRARSARKSTWRTGTMGASRLAQLSGTPVRISVRTASGTVKQTRTLPGAPAAPAPPPVSYTPPAGTYFPIQPVPTPPRGPDLTVPGLTLTLDDAAGRAALSGDLLLERAEPAGTTTSLHRIFLYGTNALRLETVARDPVAGETCDASAKYEGTWSFYRGYTFPERGGGVIAEIVTVIGGQAARDLLLFSNPAPNTVYVGGEATPYEREPDIREQC